MPGPDASAVSANAYDAIVGALASTERGRAFLAEHTRRTRTEDTRRLLDAITRLDARLDTMRAPYERDEIRTRADAVEDAVLDIARRLRPDWLRDDPDAGTGPHEGPDDLAEAARRTATAIAAHVEGIQDTAWIMREAGFDAELCDRLDQHALALGLAGARADAVAFALAGLAQATRVATVEIERLTSLTGRRAPPPQPSSEGLLTGSFAEDLDFAVRQEQASDSDAPRTGSGSAE